MPMVLPGIGAAISGIGAAITGATAAAVAALPFVGPITAAAIAPTIVSAAGNLALSLAVNALMAPRVKAQGNPIDWMADPDAGIPFAFGPRVGAAGVINHRIAYGADSGFQTLWSTLAAAGPYPGIHEVKIDGIVASFDSNGRSTAPPHEDTLFFNYKLGAQPETWLPTPSGPGSPSPAPGWTTAHKASGRLITALTMFENSKQTEYRGGEAKPLITFAGKYGWDPRQDSTWPGGTGSCRLHLPSTWVPIVDPFMAGLNWSLGMWEGPSGGGQFGVPFLCSLIGGIGARLDAIDVASLINCANIADDNGWTIAAYPTTKDDTSQVLDAMCQAGGAYRGSNAGRIAAIPFAEEQASVVTVTAADTAGPLTISLGTSVTDRKNTITPRFWSEAHGWEMTPCSPVSDPDWLDEDGARHGTALDYPYVPDADQAVQLAYYATANAREPITGTVPFKPHMRRVQPGDCFTFADPRLGLDGVKVRCLTRSIDPVTRIVTLGFRSETDAKHAKAMAQVATVTPPYGATPPPPPYVEPPQWESVTASGSDVSLFFRAPNNDLIQSVAVYRSTSGLPPADPFVTEGVGAGEYVALTDSVLPGTWYYWIEAVNVGGGRSVLVGPEMVVV